MISRPFYLPKPSRNGVYASSGYDAIRQYTSSYDDGHNGAHRDRHSHSDCRHNSHNAVHRNNRSLIHHRNIHSPARRNSRSDGHNSHHNSHVPNRSRPNPNRNGCMVRQSRGQNKFGPQQGCSMRQRRTSPRRMVERSFAPNEFWESKIGRASCRERVSSPV